MTSDAKAAQYILNATGYRYEKTHELIMSVFAVAGPGLPAVTGKYSASNYLTARPRHSTRHGSSSPTQDLQPSIL